MLKPSTKGRILYPQTIFSITVLSPVLFPRDVYNLVNSTPPKLPPDLKPLDHCRTTLGITANNGLIERCMIYHPTV